MNPCVYMVGGGEGGIRGGGGGRYVLFELTRSIGQNFDLPSSPPMITNFQNLDSLWLPERGRTG